MTAIIRTVDATLEPVSVDDVKQQTRILYDAEDTLLAAYITAARVRAEEYLGQAFVSQTWEAAFDRWPVPSLNNPLRAVPIPRPPLQRVNSVTITNSANTTTVMASSTYQVDWRSRPGRIAPAVNTYWPILMYATLNPIVVNYDAGCGGSGSTNAVTATAAAAAVPKTIKQAITLYAAYLYQVRDADAEMPRAVMDLLNLSSYGQYRFDQPDAR